jgi:hypothetical protein
LSNPVSPIILCLKRGMSMTIWLRLEVTMENEIKNLEILESENVMIQLEAINYKN